MNLQANRFIKQDDNIQIHNKPTGNILNNKSKGCDCKARSCSPSVEGRCPTSKDASPVEEHWDGCSAIQMARGSASDEDQSALILKASRQLGKAYHGDVVRITQISESSLASDGDKVVSLIIATDSDVVGSLNAAMAANTIRVPCYGFAFRISTVGERKVDMSFGLSIDGTSEHALNLGSSMVDAAANMASDLRESGSFNLIDGEASGMILFTRREATGKGLFRTLAPAMLTSAQLTFVQADGLGLISKNVIRPTFNYTGLTADQRLTLIPLVPGSPGFEKAFGQFT